MHPTRVWYKRLFNLGNFQHEEIGIEIEVGAGDTATAALEKAKRWVEGKDEERKRNRQLEIDRANAVLANRDNHLVKDVQRAEATLRQYETEPVDTEIPF